MINIINNKQSNRIREREFYWLCVTEIGFINHSS